MSAAPSNVAAVVLAAGASSRMGGRAKAELPYRGETFAARLVRMFRAHCDEVVLVHSAPVVVEGARTVVNPDPSRGMLSSLQCGLAAIESGAAAVAFTPVDYPQVSEETVESLIMGWRGESLRIPRHGGRRGHPVLVARTLLSEFLALPVSARARDLIHRHEHEIVYFDVNDPGILRDIDTPAEYEELR